MPAKTRLWDKYNTFEKIVIVFFPLILIGGIPDTVLSIKDSIDHSDPVFSFISKYATLTMWAGFIPPIHNAVALSLILVILLIVLRLRPIQRMRQPAKTILITACALCLGVALRTLFLWNNFFPVLELYEPDKVTPTIFIINIFWTGLLAAILGYSLSR